MQWVGDGDGEERLDEEEVESQTGQDGGEQSRPDAADQRDDDDEQLVGEHVRGDAISGLLVRKQQPRQQRTDDEGDGEAERLATDAERPARDAGQREPRHRLRRG